MRTRTWTTIGAGLIAAGLSGTAGAATGSLISIGVLDPANPESAIKAIAADGSCAVGYSKGPSIDGARIIRLPVFWAADTGLVKLPNPEPNGPGTDIDGEARGVVLRPLHEPIGEGIGISGSIGFFQDPAGTGPAISAVWQFYKAPRGDPAAGTGWTTGGSAGNSQEPSPIGAYNTSRLLPGPNESWFMVGKRRNGQVNNVAARGNWVSRANNLRIDPLGLTDYPALMCDGSTTGVNYGIANSVATNRRSVGFDSGNTAGAACNAAYRALYYPTVNASGQVIPGGSKIFSQGFGISSDGNVLSGVDATAFTGTHAVGAPDLVPTQGQAFTWKVGDEAMTLLNNLPGDVLGCAIAVNDFSTAVGYSSDGTTERAVIWDKSGIWDTSGDPKVLTDVLAGFGVNTSEWVRLSRVTSISDNGNSVAGWGVWAADGSTRGFVATSPAALGACCRRSALGSGTCSLLTADQCAAAGGSYLGDDSICGEANANCGDFCGTPWADADLDGDVDGEDFGFFQACYTGTTLIGLSPGCACMDKFKVEGAGSDGLIDQADYEPFSRCATGPEIPFDTANPPPGCLP